MYVYKKKSHIRHLLNFIKKYTNIGDGIPASAAG